jgi:hypothetical protein
MGAKVQSLFACGAHSCPATPRSAEVFWKPVSKMNYLIWKTPLKLWAGLISDNHPLSSRWCLARADLASIVTAACNTMSTIYIGKHRGWQSCIWRVLWIQFPHHGRISLGTVGIGMISCWQFHPWRMIGKHILFQCQYARNLISRTYVQCMYTMTGDRSHFGMTDVV